MPRAGEPPTLVVVNPRSAGGRTERRWAEIQRALQRSGVRLSFHLTLGTGDATLLTRQAIADEGIRRVVAVGGDGTVNEVVNGCFAEDGTLLGDDLTVGLIASGTAGDFRRTLGLPDDPVIAARVLAAGTTRRLDVGRVTLAGGAHRYFANIASCGISADVVARVDRHRPAWGRLRTASFLAAALASLATYRNREVLVTVDSEVRPRRIQQVVMANSRWFGAGMMIAPLARPDDGLLDVVTVGDISRLASILALPRLYRGRHLTLPEVEHTRARSVRIEPSGGEDPPLLEADGELLGPAPAEVTILPGALRFSAPNHAG
ncbi:MAG TPA: diacylglycerol kinase family protein [Candidatus Binatia bacterium]|nr:diacylglycerol kinase family protein [Candidatus Binatia bacterium]